MTNLPINVNEVEASNTEIIDFQNVYSPSTLLGVYANAIRSSVDGKLVIAKGIYQMSNISKEYSGYYYDDIKTPNDNRTIKTKVPSLLRSQLQNNQIYIFKGYIEKRINFSSIELVFVIDEILKKERNPISEEDLKSFHLIQEKMAKGFQDLESLIKSYIYKGETFRIANLYGNTAIVHKDFEKGLAEASKYFSIMDYRCNFASKIEIIRTLNRINNDEFHAIALVRGGGEKAGLEIFNNVELGAEIIKLNSLVITALGHTIDETLIDKLADKKFALPHDYGNSLKVLVDNAVEEQNKSKSVLIDQVKKDLSKTFQDQITTLQNQLLARNKENETAQQKFKEMIEQHNKEKLETISTKEKAFDSQIKSLVEQIKTKDESFNKLQTNYETSVKYQISAAVADIKSKHDVMLSENDRLSKQLRQISNKGDNLIIYIIIAIVIGIVIGTQFK